MIRNKGRTSSFVVWFETDKYVWNPARPRIDQMEKKHTAASTIVAQLKKWTEEKPVNVTMKQAVYNGVELIILQDTL